jgi:hypothetical protein
MRIFFMASPSAVDFNTSRARVHQDARADQLARKRLGEAQHARLRRGVRGDVRRAFLADDRRDVDDAAVAGGAHPRHGHPATVEDAGQVDAQHAIPCVERVVLHGQHRAVDAGVVDQDVDPLERVARGCEAALDRRVVADVDGNAKRRPESGGRFVQSRKVAIPHDDPATLGREAGRDASSDAACAAGDDRHLPCQRPAHAVLLVAPRR